MKKALEI